MSGETELKIPTHVGFIMDGNRRWAKKRGLATFEGHKEGELTLLKILKACGEAGVKYTTFYGFSTENWNRDKEEIAGVMKLFGKAIVGRIPELNKNNVRLNFIGNREDMSAGLQKDIKKAEEATAQNTGTVFNLAFSYGGQAEVVNATREVLKKGLKPEDVTTESFRDFIYEAGQPDLDLIIRTGGQKRLSGFMMWQSTYAELYFTDTLWPDFDEGELGKAFEFFAEQKRNFGK